MTPRSLRALRAVLACTAASVLVPAAAAQASTWTVDDDGVQCPNAGYTKIQAAVNQAAPWDTVIVCDGTYQESATPASTTQSPSQTGSMNGLTITKPLTIKGTGSGKVFIEPAPSLGATLAGTAPYLRDGGGNVITVSKQSAGSTDDNENYVDISGVTVRSPTAYAEAGIAFFNASGAVRNSVVGPLKRAADGPELAARPHGWGIVMTNHMQGNEAGVVRQVNVSGSLVTGYQSGGILFDDSRGTDGAAENLLRSGIKAYGRVTTSRIQGSGPDALIPQTGVRWHAGQRGFITKSVITGNFFTTDQRQSVGLLLTDAETGNDPSNPTVRGFWALENQITGNGWGMFNADIANAAVRLGAPAAATPGALGLENWWGCSTGPVIGAQSTTSATTSCQGISGADSASAQSIELGVVRTAAPFLPATPAPTVDDNATASFSEPVADGVVFAGKAVDPTVVAKDDFGVKSVKVSKNGTEIATKSTYPYEFASFTPGFDEIGTTITLEAVVTDSAGQTTTETIDVDVVAAKGYAPITVTTDGTDFGPVLVGGSLVKTMTVKNSGQNPLTLGALDVSGAGFTGGGGSCVSGMTLAVDETCTLPVTFTPGAAGGALGQVSVAYTTPGADSPELVSMTGTGMLPPPEPPPPAPPTPPAPPPPPPAPPFVSVKTSLATNVKPSSSRLVTVGSMTCGTAATCTAKVTASLTIGSKTYTATKTVTAKTGKKATLAVQLSSSAVSALKKTKSKQAKFKVISQATDTGGGKTLRTKTMTIRA